MYKCLKRGAPKYTQCIQKAIRQAKRNREKKNNLPRAKPVYKAYHGQVTVIHAHSNPLQMIHIIEDLIV